MYVVGKHVNTLKYSNEFIIDTYKLCGIFY